MEEDADQIVQLQALNERLYALIARLGQEIDVLRERVTAAQIGIMLLNQRSRSMTGRSTMYG